ncbi:MAG: nuclear transport factor 2 family protein [Acidobacteria bacterium]|nr:nuclear transport factor 2 family protein [Acidobacteriota bacterium]
MVSVEERLQEIEAKLRYLENLEVIRKRLGQYCRALDAKDVKLMEPLFSQDIELSVIPWGFEFRGRQPVLEFYARAFLDSSSTRHNYTNEHIEADGEGYKSFCYFHSTVELTPHSLIGWGTYEDTLILEDGVWKFKKKVITVLVLTPIDKGWAGPDKILPVHS